MKPRKIWSKIPGNTLSDALRHLNFFLRLTPQNFSLRQPRGASRPILLPENWVSWISPNIWRDTVSKWTHRLLKESGPWEWGSLYKGFQWGQTFVQKFGRLDRTYRGLPKIYQGFSARDSRSLPWKHIKKIEYPSFQIFTGVPVTYMFLSFHWSPHNLQVFTGVPEFPDRFPWK